MLLPLLSGAYRLIYRKVSGFNIKNYEYSIQNTIQSILYTNWDVIIKINKILIDQCKNTVFMTNNRTPSFRFL